MEFPDRFAVIVKPSAPKTEVLGYDKDIGAYRIAIAAKAEDNKANVELIKLLSRLSGRRARITAGKTGRRKLISLES